MQVNLQEFKDIEKALAKIERATITKVQKMNNLRGKKFKEDTIRDTRADRLALKQNKPATVVIQGKAHSPEFFTGKLLDAMEVKENEDQSIEAGYFAGDARRPPDTDISYADIATLQHTGYRIPLAGPKGERVRAWLAMQGIFPKKSREFLTVSPRPFIYKSIERSEEKGVDVKIVNGYMDDLWKSL